MLDTSKKAILFGLGALEFTREKAEAFVDELVEKGKIVASERAGVLDELLTEAEKKENAALTKIKNAVNDLIRELNLATKDDLKGIEERLSRIEEYLSAHGDKPSS